jgi:hypothetical protein
MFEYGDDRMDEAQIAAVEFIDNLDPAYDYLALIRFSEDAETQKGLRNYYHSIKDTINNYYLDDFSGYTNISEAIEESIDELTSDESRDDAIKIAILLSDGGVNRPLNNGKEDIGYAKSKAMDSAENARDEDIIIYTIALNGPQNTDKELLEDIADITGGESFEADDLDELIDAYSDIASTLTNILGTNAEVYEKIRKEFNYVNGSAVPTPNQIKHNGDGTTELRWSFGGLEAGEHITVRYRISPDDSGNDQKIAVYPDSAIQFRDRWGGYQSYPFPQGELDVSVKDCSPDKDDDDDNDDDDDDNDNGDNDDDNDGDDNDNDTGLLSAFGTGGPFFPGDVAGESTQGYLSSGSEPTSFIGGLKNIFNGDVAGAGLCVDPRFWWLMFAVQAILHAIIYMILDRKFVSKRKLFYVGQILLTALAMYWFWKHYCPLWDVLVAMIIGWLATGLTIRKGKRLVATDPEQLGLLDN